MKRDDFLRELGDMLAQKHDLTISVSGDLGSGKLNLELFIEDVVNATPELHQHINTEAATLNSPRITHFTLYRNRG